MDRIRLIVSLEAFHLKINEQFSLQSITLDIKYIFSLDGHFVVFLASHSPRSRDVVFPSVHLSMSMSLCYKALNSSCKGFLRVANQPRVSQESAKSQLAKSQPKVSLESA